VRTPLRLLALAAAFLACAVLCLTLGVALLSSTAFLGELGVISPVLVPSGPPSAQAATQVPAQMLSLYRSAATVCPGLPWTVLAAIGTVESSNGTSQLPGVHSGANYAGAEGPMQFEPSTFAEYDRPVPTGGADPPSPYDPTDAVFAAARLLCANGAAEGADISGAIYAYNHSKSYVAEVLSLAEAFGK
jgi:membrane-bound lytic murein transglycosylase B